MGVYDLPPDLKKSVEKILHAHSRTSEIQTPWIKERGLSSVAICADYFEPFDLHLCIIESMEEFTAPMNIIRSTIITAAIIAGVVGVIVFLFAARGIARPFTNLSDTSSRITQGDLTARADTKSLIEEFSSVSKGMNMMIDDLQDKIGEIRRSEVELKESNEFNQTLIENLLVAIWMCDEEGRCNLVNKEFTGLLGWTREELLETHAPNFPYFCKSGLPYMKEGSAEAANKIWKHAVEKKEIGAGEVPFITKDGRIVVHRGVEIPYGKRESRLWVSGDITELKNKETNLKNAILTFGSVLSSAASGDLKAKVDLSKIAEEYKSTGEDINSMISARKHETDRLKQREGEMGEVLSLYGYTIEKIVGEGDLSIRVDIERLSGKHKLIGTYVNLLISGLQTKIEESKKRKEE